jgi:hypothetical protein
MEADQERCPECGAAAAGASRRRGFRLRSHAGAVAATLVVGLMAAGGAYAGLSSRSGGTKNPNSGTPAPIPAGPVTPDVPVASVPAPNVPVQAATGATQPTVASPPKLPAATPTPQVATPAPVASTTPKPVATTTTPATETTPATGTTSATNTTPATTLAQPTTTTKTAPVAAKPSSSPLDAAVASTYNPYGAPAASFGDPAKAIDGDAKTSWTYQLDPSSDGKTLVGLAIKLKTAQMLDTVKITTPSPGMTVELYGAEHGEPATINDPLWLHLTSGRDIKASTTLHLDTLGESLDYLLVWVTAAPSGTTSGTLGISEVLITKAAE